MSSKQVAKLIFKGISAGADRIPDNWFEKVPGGYFKAKEEGLEALEQKTGYSSHGTRRMKKEATRGRRAYSANASESDSDEWTSEDDYVADNEGKDRRRRQKRGTRSKSWERDNARRNRRGQSLPPTPPGSGSNRPRSMGPSPQQPGYYYGNSPQPGSYRPSPQQSGYYGSSPQPNYYGPSPQQQGYYGQSPQQPGYQSQPPQQPGYYSPLPQQIGYQGQPPQQFEGYGQSPQPAQSPQQQGQEAQQPRPYNPADYALIPADGTTVQDPYAYQATREDPAAYSTSNWVNTNHPTSPPNGMYNGQQHPHDMAGTPPYDYQYYNYPPQQENSAAAYPPQDYDNQYPPSMIGAPPLSRSKSAREHSRSNKDKHARSKSQSGSPSRQDRAVKSSKGGLGKPALGAVAGGLAASEIGHAGGMATLVGAALGGVGMYMLEKRRKSKSQSRGPEQRAPFAEDFDDNRSREPRSRDRGPQDRDSEDRGSRERDYSRGGDRQREKHRRRSHYDEDGYQSY